MPILIAHSCFSLRYGVYRVEELVEDALQNGYSAVALCDINNTSAAFEFVKVCREKGIKPLLGVDFRNGSRRCYVLLASDDAAWGEICRFLSLHLESGEDFPEQAPLLEGVWVLYGDEVLREGEVPYLDERSFVAVRMRGTRKLLRGACGVPQHKLLGIHELSFPDKIGYNTHKLLRAIDLNKLLSKLEPKEMAEPDEVMIDQSALAAAFAPHPYLIRNSLDLCDRCSVNMEMHVSKNRLRFTGNPNDDKQLLQKLAFDGMTRRYKKSKNITQVRKRVEHELQIIDELSFSTYFLITWDIVRYAQSRGFRHVGRGSGANSIVAYCLGITDVDPIELDLYFERFINPHRTSPPDFDVDFSWDERDEVTDYIFKRYGHRHTALLATYNTFKGRSILRELGKVFGLPKAEIDKLVKQPEQEQHYDAISRLILQYGKRIENLPNYLSIHAGGILITEQPLHHHVATWMPPKGFLTTQFDMFTAEDAGFYKYDILSQRGLGHIKETVELVYQNRGEHIDIDRVEDFKRDAKLNAMLAKGNTIGCFYIESPAMRQLLIKLRCADYITLVAASSIIRPGVAKSGMMRSYIERHLNPDKVIYAHPKMKEILSETYGVMVYQEDVIKVAYHFAGLDLAEADILRRAMSGKYRSKDGFKRIEEKFFRLCAEKGYPEKVSMEVWRQMKSFSGYSFSKAHSASFAVESYQSLFLKAYYPLEFMVAVINNFGGFYRTEYYINEARLSGAYIHHPCVNRSDYLTCIHGKDIYLGFVHITHLEKSVAERILQERLRGGTYKDLDDFCERVPLRTEQMQILIKSKTLRFTGISKKRLYWMARMQHMPVAVGAENFQGRMFHEPVRTYNIPEFQDLPMEDAYDDLELFDFTLSNPFDMLAEDISGCIDEQDMQKHKGRWVKMAGYLVTTKDLRAGNGEHMQFGTYWDQHGHTFDAIHFPDTARQFPLKGKGIYRLEGKIVEDFGVYNIEVKKVSRLALHPDPRSV